jgi:subtilase family serine protease
MVNRNTGAFYALSFPSRSSLSDRIAIRFEVKNTGTKTSPAWFFRANLPTAQNDTFNSQAQTALRPGESIIFTLAFDNFVNSNSGVASITVDPSNYVVESNENNNFITQTINTVP